MQKYIPTPTGVYPVGIYKTEMTDHMRKDTYGFSCGSRRLAAWIYYPANRVGEKMHYGIREDLAKLNIPWEDNFIDCSENAPSATGSFPVIIYSHGYNGNLYIHTSLCADLASHGYIVVSITHPYEAHTVRYQDGTVVEFHKPFGEAIEASSITEKLYFLSVLLDKFSSYKHLAKRQCLSIHTQISKFTSHVNTWSQDNSFVLDELIKLNKNKEFLLYGRLDLQHGVGVAGQSFGGTAATNSCFLDKRFACVLNLDGMVYGACSLKDIGRPYMRIGQKISKYMALTPLGYSTAPVYDISVKGVTHMGYTDWKYILPDNKKMVGTMQANRFFQVLTQYAHFFFDKYLKGDRLQFPIFDKNIVKTEFMNING